MQIGQGTPGGGSGVWQCFCLVVRVKLRLAERTLALWARRRGWGFTGAHRRLNRVFGALVLGKGEGVAPVFADQESADRRRAGTEM